MSIEHAFLRVLLVTLLAASSPVFAQSDVLQRPPARPLTNAPKLSPLLVDARGREITAKSGWARQRETIRKQWLEFLGPLPARKPPLKTQVLAMEQLDGFTRQHVQYQIEDGLFTDGYLLTPAAA